MSFVKKFKELLLTIYDLILIIKGVVNMKKVIFEDPCGNKESVTDIKLLKKLLIDEFNTYWMRGSVEGVFDFYDNDEKISTLIVAPNTEYGLYLHFIDNISDTDLLSLMMRIHCMK